MGICCLSDLRKIEKQKKQMRREVETQCLSGGLDVMSAAVAEDQLFPDHLIVMVNGIFGSASEWKFAAQQFVKVLPDRVIVRCSKCNPTSLTFDGVDLMGERLVDEVLAVVRHRPWLRKISFIGHSLGGLVIRYAIGKLYEPFSVGLEDERISSNKFERNGKIAGLEPVNFITVATPHLGSQGHKQLPCLCGVPCLEWKVRQAARMIAGRSGEHLFLTDNDDEGKPPLLLQMVSDSYEFKFISALRSFKRRVVYANAHNDPIVGWRTSSIHRQCELPKGNVLSSDKKYPHIVYIEPETSGDIGRTSGSSCVENQTTDLEEVMIRGLNQVSWERIHVHFQNTSQRCMAHSTIEVRCYWLNSKGADIISHIIDNFLV